MFLNSPPRVFKLCIIRKKFPGRIFAQQQESGARLVMVTNESVPRFSTAFFAFLQTKNVFFNKLEILTFTDLVENFKPERLCCKILVSKRLGRGTHS